MCIEGASLFLSLDFLRPTLFLVPLLAVSIVVSPSNGEASLSSFFPELGAEKRPGEKVG